MEPSSPSTCRSSHPPGSDKIILLIDEDREFRAGLAAQLREDGHEVREYAEPQDVLCLPTNEDVGAVIRDYQIPTDRDSLGFAEFFHRRHPGVPIVLISAYWPDYLARRAAKRRYLHLCYKPIEYEDLHGLLHELSRGAATAPPP